MKEEVQLTAGHYGHTLNPAQAFTADGQWVVYDTRNDGTHIGRTCCIEKVNVLTGAVIKLYSVAGQTEHGPGVGAVACHPHDNKVIFIHGLENCTAQRPYGFTRRFGAIHHEGHSGIIHAEARVVDAPLVAGALRGGTHAHSWSGDGEWISFTYNDYIMESLERTTAGKVKDLRTIGVMAQQKKVAVSSEDAENFSGEYFVVVAATVVETPVWGSDEIEKAFDECWVGNDGYKRSDGGWQKRAIAFQGHVRDVNGNLLTEVFVADIPDDITQAVQGKPLEGTRTSRPNVPAHLRQRRVTYTGTRLHPGLQGPRAWLRTSPDGAYLYFLMKDDNGIVQVYKVPATGGDIRQVTRLAESVQTQFNLNADGTMLAFGAGNAVWVADVGSGAATRLTQKYTGDEAPITTVLWNPQGDMLVYNRYVGTGSERYLQILKCKM